MSKATDMWMPLVIGDYLKDTQHLDATRHGCYLLWLMHYWIKGPLPNSIEDLLLIGKLRGPDAPSIAHALLLQFFFLGDDGLYHQKRADHEKTKWKSKQQKAHDKAVDAANTRWDNNAPSIAQALPDTMPVQCPSPSPSPSPSTSPPFPLAENRGEEAPRSGGGNGSRAPTPAAGLSPTVPSEIRDDATHTTRAVIDELGFSTRNDYVYHAIHGQAVVELRGGQTVDNIRDAMVWNWKRYRECVKSEKTTSRQGMSAEKFFGEGRWKSSKDWGLKKGMSADGITV